jgi:GAF domain-containing protein
MNWQILASSIAIFGGALVMAYCIIKIQSTFKSVELIPESKRSSIIGFLKTHRFLMFIFLAGYIAVAVLLLVGVNFVSNLVVGAIFFLGAIFVLIGLLLQSKILAAFESRIHEFQAGIGDIADIPVAYEEQDTIRQWRERLAIIILRVATGLGFFAIVATVINDIKTQNWFDLITVLVFYLVLVVITVFKVPHAVRAYGLVVLTYLFTVNGLLVAGIRSDAGVFMIASVLLAFLLIGIRAGMITFGIHTITLLGTALAVLAQRYTLVLPFDQLTPEIWITNGIVTLLLTGIISLGAITMQRAFAATQRREYEVYNELIAERAHLAEEVEMRTRDLRLAAQVGTSISAIRDLDEILKNAVETVQETFDLYFAQVYLVDSLGKNLVLRASTAEVGQNLMMLGHQLPVSLTSITGSVAVERKAILVEDAEANSLFRPNPQLPETCEEMAVPLMVGERVVGVLDLHSSQPGKLSEVSLPAFEALAGQLGIALTNAELFSQAEQARLQLEQQAGMLARTGWDEYLDGIERPERLGYLYEEDALRPLTEVDDVEFDGNTLMQPIKLVGEKVGSIQLEGSADWSQDEIELVENISQQVAQRLENLRLLAQSQQYQQDAEAALRRLTRDGWDSYQSAAGLSFIHSDHQVKAFSSENVENALVFDFMVREEPIGTLGILDVDHLPETDKAFVNEVQEQLSTHIEALRLQDQTQQALAATEELYQASDRISKAANLEEVLAALVESTALNRLQRVGLLMYNRPWQDENPPEQVTIAGSWLAEGIEARGPIGSVYKFDEFPVTYIFSQNEPYISRDIQSDEWSHEPSRQMIMNIFNTNGIATFPLRIGDESIGGVTAMSEGKMEITDEEIRQISTLIDQAATVIQTQQLYEKAQLRAQREHELREISEAVRAAVDPETILRRAARQVGSALGRKTVVRLGADQNADDGNTGKKSA